MMKKHILHKPLLILLILACAFGLIVGMPISSATDYELRDIEDSYAAEQIASLYDAGIVAGDEHGYFHPKRAVTRQEFVAMLNRTLGVKPVASSIVAYSDVPKNSWAYGDVQAAASLGTVNGISASLFQPKRVISREEAAVILVRALADASGSTSAASSLKDGNGISKWAAAHVSAAIENGWMTGYQGNFRPADSLTREETAVLFERIHAVLAAKKATADEPISLGWQYQLSTAQYIEQVKQSNVNTLSPRWFFINKDGSVSDSADASLVQWAHENDKEVWPLFGNRFDSATTHAVLSDAGKRAAMVQTIAQYVEKYNLDGINVDFEGFSPNNRDHFTAFIRELAVALDAHDAVVSVDIPPDTGTDWSDPFDYAKLAEYADYLVVMAYDQHWSGSPKAGSVATLPWMEGVVTKLLDYIPANKLVVGLPFYTREWYTASNAVKSNDLSLPASYQMVQANRGSIWWDAALGQYVSTYNKQGVKYTAWLEDSRSLGRKAVSSHNREVAGLAYWYVGSESSDVWTALNNAIVLKQVRETL